MNVELLRAVKEHILAEPKRLDMGVFIERLDPEADRPMPKCGTVGCIAGWTCLLTHGMHWDGDVYGEAAKLLGLNPRQAHSLFMNNCHLYATSEAAEEIADYIEHFIKTAE